MRFTIAWCAHLMLGVLGLMVPVFVASSLHLLDSPLMLAFVTWSILDVAIVACGFAWMLEHKL